MLALLLMLALLFMSFCIVSLCVFCMRYDGFAHERAQPVPRPGAETVQIKA